MSGIAGEDNLPVARTLPTDPGRVSGFLRQRPELLDRGLCIVASDLRPPQLPVVPALGVDETGRLVVLECLSGDDADALTVLDHLEWLAGHLSLLESTGSVVRLPDPSCEWRVFVVLPQPSLRLPLRLRWVSDVVFEYFLARFVQIREETAIMVEPWNAWRLRDRETGKASGVETEVVAIPVLDTEESELEMRNEEVVLTPEERSAFLQSVRRTVREGN